MINYTPEHVADCARFLQDKGIIQSTIGIVLGTGLGAFTREMEIELTIPYQEIPYFPTSTVEFHKGQLVYGSIGSKKVLAMQGRFHYYEGYSMQQITFPIRVMKALGVRYLFLSNAAGGMNPSFKKGDLVLLDDHINLQPDNPLRGMNDPSWGQRFVDLCAPYDGHLNALFEMKASELKIPLKKGVYVAVMGPNLETRAEYRWLRNTGADMVGMSTVPEVIVANQVGLPCAAVSVITDECDPDNLKPVNIAEIIEVAGKSDKTLSLLVKAVMGAC
ncbi:MAG: purine-nucleoside phosphorylase [Chitinophagaceae bacterium]|uniref:purine-nucleoside phosphorylase n=1 Tax=unclassified Paraflavitalea TaxID=2798305 RepID=UPI003D344E8F|nr:purine-nucleoside phosphorylase [Chitinophagaceae bacterium]